MMRDRRFGGDIRIGSPTRVDLRGGKENSPPRWPSRDLGTLSPTRATARIRDYPRDVRTGSPTRASMQAREMQDYSRDLRLQRQDTRDHSPPRGFRERRPHFVPGLSSLSGDDEMEKSRRVLSSEHPGGSVRGSDYGRHWDEDRDRQLQKLSQFNEGLSQRDSTSRKFQWKHLLDEPKRTNGNANHCSNNYPDNGTSSTRVSAERSYQSSGFADMSHSGMRVDKPMPVETKRDRTYPASYPLESGTSRCFDIGDGCHLLQSQKFCLHMCEDFRFQDQLPADELSADKLSARDLYKEEEIPKLYSREEKPPFYSTDTSLYVTPSSQSKMSSTLSFGIYFNDSCGDGFPARSDGFNSRNSGMLTEPNSREAYARISHLKSCRDPNLQQEDMTNYRQVQLSSNEGTREGYTYPDARRSEKSEMAALSHKRYRKMESIQDDYGRQDLSAYRIGQPIRDKIVVAEGSHRDCLMEGTPWDQYHSSQPLLGSRNENLVESTLWDQYHSSQEQPISNYLEAAGSSYASKNDREALDHRSMHLKYETEENHGFGRDAGMHLEYETEEDHGYRRDARMHLRYETEEDHGYGRDAGLQPDDERLNMSMMMQYDPGFDGIDDTHQEGFAGEELDLMEKPKIMLKRKLDVETKLSRLNRISRFSSNRKISCKIDDANSSKSLMYASRYKNVGRTMDDVGQRKSNSVASGWSSVRNPWKLKSNVRDIKKRLGSRARDIKKRLGPVPQQVHIPHNSEKIQKVQRFLRNNQDGCHGSIHDGEECPLGGNLHPAKSEPSEKSEEFKQLVHSAFFKFIKQLNENPAQRRRLKAQGKAGSLKCSVCGRDSEEFLDTESLVLHACTCPKVGCRAQHLGFQRALCSLMGWRSAEIFDSQWVRQLLPDAETVALKEDLILWPPIVIIHNSSIRNINPDGRVIVSVQMLEGILRDMGFGEKTKVCRGKPANQSTIMVKFSGTFSGFQEAEKLHKLYAGNKRGRTEFLHINANSSGDGETQKASPNNVEQFLYGYLGIAEDLDKLDFETKKWCSVRSRKEIQKIVDAPLIAEWESNCQ